jgi:DNA repair protein RecO (recombination protein O)
LRASKRPIVETEALVLRRFDYSETSQIARLFTRDEGRLSVIAKGIRRPNADLRGPMDLFCLADVGFVGRPHDELLVLRRYHVVTGFPGLRRSLARMNAAFYLAELLCEGTRDRDPDPALFDLWVASLRALETATAEECDPIVLRAELGFLDASGFLPSLDRCVRCGAPVAAAESAALSPGRGGVLCAACGEAAVSTGVLRLTAGQRRTLLHLLGVAPSRARTVALLPRDRRVLRRALTALLEHVLEKELHSARFLARSQLRARAAPGSPTRA